MRRFKLLALLAVFLLVGAACKSSTSDNGGENGGGNQGADTGTVTVLSAMEPEEADALNAIIDEKIESQVDYTVEIEANADFEEQLQIRVQGGNPPDVAMLPQPGSIPGLAADAVSLEDLGLNINDLNSTFGDYFVSLGEFDGQHYGIPSNINLKSMIWYPKDDFDAAGYQIPSTWDELLALSDQIVADGGTPWCVGFESGGASGWPATDWTEDIMLRTAGPDVYDQWVAHEIPFNDPSVQHAEQLFGDVMFHPGYVLGGADKTPSIAFGDAPGPMFQEPPGCWLHRQANFINSFFPADAEASVDYDWFPFPTIDDPNQEAALFAGEPAMVFRNAPEVKDFIERFTSTEVQCAQGASVGTSRISPNVNVGGDCYANPLLAGAADVLTAALKTGNARFDASDQMPPEVGQASFWTGMVEYMQGGPDSLDGILEDIENSWPAS